MIEESSRAMLGAPQIPEYLEARISDLELRIKEQDESAQLRETELLAMERDLVLKEAYAKRLELDQHLLSVELGQVRARAAELFGDLERAERRIAELGALCASVQSQACYRVSVKAVRILDRLGPVAKLVRRLTKRLRRP